MVIVMRFEGVDEYLKNHMKFVEMCQMLDLFNMWRVSTDVHNNLVVCVYLPVGE